jgi:dnd system-associated protein 4
LPESRIGYEREKRDFVRRLVAADEGGGPFETIADVLVFAASLGLRRSRRVPLRSVVSETIRQEVFDRGGYGIAMDLIVLGSSANANVLSNADEAVSSRINVFQEYANGGLEILESELRGAVDPLGTLVLILTAERNADVSGDGGFDLSQLVT